MTDFPFTIEKGIPVPRIPAYRRNAGRPPRYDWSALEPGDSVLLPDRSAAMTSFRFGASHRRVFTMEKQIEGKRGWRVWRVS